MPDAAALIDPGVRQGYFGKLPGHGDFVRAGLPEDVVEGWDLWLRAGLAEGRAALGEAWQEAFLEAPVWRFRFGPGLIDRAGLAGVMAPSVDRAGRYFPLMLGAAMASPPEPDEAAAWFDALDAAVTHAVCDDWNQARLREALAAAGAPAQAVPHTGATLATRGAPRVAACIRRFDALPPTDVFASLFDDRALR